MPELPEVETIRTGLAPLLIGRRFTDVYILDRRLTRPVPTEHVRRALRGERVTGLRRRGKYLVVDFASGRHLLIHLRMTGSLRHEVPSARTSGSYQRAVVRLDDGSDVVFRDVRRFATWSVVSSKELDEYWSGRLGEEPLGTRFTTSRFVRALAGRRASIKAVLLDQRTVAGIGNIYADEALWRARIHPCRPAGSLDGTEVAALRRALRRALRLGIERQGATLRNYRDSAGRKGRMQQEFKVYGRDGEACPRCRGAIEKIRLVGRGTCFCPTCQRRRA